MDKVCLRLKVIYFNQDYEVFIIPLNERSGSIQYALSGCLLDEKQGFLSYYAEIIGPEVIYNTWKHQLWVEPQDSFPILKREFPESKLLD